LHGRLFATIPPVVFVVFGVGDRAVVCTLAWSASCCTVAMFAPGRATN
jgi:hypothetical protein